MILQKEVFILVDSQLKNMYEIDIKRTWAEQRQDIIEKLLPPLFEIMDKRYNILNSVLLKMLYGR